MGGSCVCLRTTASNNTINITGISGDQLNVLINQILAHPQETPINLSNEIPKEYADLFIKARKVLKICPETSATCSRKCMELILINIFKAKKWNLSDKIKEVEKFLPSDFWKDLDFLIDFGNFGAHPKKDTSTGELIQVEKGEAEYCLYLLECLFDECFIKPKNRENILIKVQYKKHRAAE